MSCICAGGIFNKDKRKFPIPFKTKINGAKILDAIYIGFATTKAVFLCIEVQLISALIRQ